MQTLPKTITFKDMACRNPSFGLAIEAKGVARVRA